MKNIKFVLLMLFGFKFVQASDSLSIRRDVRVSLEAALEGTNSPGSSQHRPLRVNRIRADSRFSSNCLACLRRFPEHFRGCFEHLGGCYEDLLSVICSDACPVIVPATCLFGLYLFSLN